MTRNKHILMAFAFAFAILVVVPSVFVMIRTSDPEFCLSCHFEKPYYESWKESTHSDIACVECHPSLRWEMPWITFRYMVGLYDMKTHADVETDTCLKCHDKEKLFSEPLKLVDKKSFSHKQHLEQPMRGVQLRCASCHSHIVQGEHRDVEETVCFTCHFMGASPADSITGCESCHLTPKGTVTRHGFSFNHEKYLKMGMSCGECHLKITEGTGQMQPDACHRCHVEPDQRPDRQTIHDIHVKESGVDCGECHGNIRHGNLEMVKTFDVSCDSCHENLHGAQKELYMGVGGDGIGDYPSRMFAAQVTCDGCHTGTVEHATAFATETTRLPEARACVTCHEPGFDDMLKDWQRSFKGILGYVKQRIRAAAPRANTREKKAIVRRAQKNLALVDSGRPAHNVEYAIKLLAFTTDELDQVQSASRQSRPRELRTSDGYCASMCHNRLGMPEDLLYQGETAFPHDNHLKAVGPACGTCHSTEHHGQTNLTKTQCNTCHHVDTKNVEDRCDSCHRDVAGFFEGRLAGFDAGDANLMLDAVSCIECHDVTTGDPVTVDSVRQTCVDCHDEDYGSMLDDWMDTGLAHRKELNARVAELEEMAVQRRSVNTVNARIVEQEFKKLKAVQKLFSDNMFVHNPDQADVLYEEAIASYDRIKELLN